jgi:hypothetical protein
MAAAFSGPACDMRQSEARNDAAPPPAGGSFLHQFPPKRHKAGKVPGAKDLISFFVNKGT